MRSENLQLVIDLLTKASTEKDFRHIKTAQSILRGMASKPAIDKLSSAISKYTTPNYFKWTEFFAGLNEVLSNNGFEEINWPQRNGSNYIDGRFNSEILSSDGMTKTYLAITWYEMPSGKYEFVAYIHP